MLSFRVRILKDRKGIMLLTSLILLMIIGTLALISSSSVLYDQRMSAHALTHAKVFYNAEAGINHAVQDLVEKYKGGSGGANGWTFVLNGTLYAGEAKNVFCEDCISGSSTHISGGWLSGGVEVLKNEETVDNVKYVYTVTAWDNDETDRTDSGRQCPNSSPAKDCDGVIVIRSVSESSLGSNVTARAVQELTLIANLGGLPVLNTTPQAGSGSGKAGESGDSADVGGSFSSPSSIQ